MLMNTKQSDITKTAVLIGGGYAPAVISAVVEMTARKNPKILIVPTAGNDTHEAAEYATALFLPHTTAENIGVLNLIYESPSRDEIGRKILSADLVFVLGGCTERLMTNWERTGASDFMREAYDRGIVLAGSSAGGICWSYAGYNDFSSTDYRFCKGLGIIPVYFGPHFQSEKFARFDDELLHTVPAANATKGYGVDNDAAIAFRDGVPSAIRALPENRIIEYTYSDGRWVSAPFAG